MGVVVASLLVPSTSTAGHTAAAAAEAKQLAILHAQEQTSSLGRHMPVQPHTGGMLPANTLLAKSAWQQPAAPPAAWFDQC